MVSISISMAISTISMMIISRGSIGSSLSISISMAISTISMSITMMIITRGGISFPLSIAVAMAIPMRVSMVVISWLSISFSYSTGFSFSLSIAVAMMTIATITMMVISWLSYSCSKEGKRNSNQKIHLLVGLNSSETPPCTLR